MAVAMRAVAPVAMPLPRAMMTKKTGKDRERAARTWVEMSPPKYVSTTLYIVLKKNPMLAGNAILRMSVGMGA